MAGVGQEQSRSRICAFSSRFFDARNLSINAARSVVKSDTLSGGSGKLVSWAALLTCVSQTICLCLRISLKVSIRPGKLADQASSNWFSRNGSWTIRGEMAGRAAARFWESRCFTSRNNSGACCSRPARRANSRVVRTTLSIAAAGSPGQLHSGAGSKDRPWRRADSSLEMGSRFLFS